MKPYNKEQAEQDLRANASREIQRAIDNIQRAANEVYARLKAESGLAQGTSSVTDLFQAATYVDCHDVNTNRCGHSSNENVSIGWEVKFNGYNVIPWPSGHEAPPCIPHGKYRVVLFVLPLEDK